MPADSGTGGSTGRGDARSSEPVLSELRLSGREISGNLQTPGGCGAPPMPHDLPARASPRAPAPEAADRRAVPRHERLDRCASVRTPRRPRPNIQTTPSGTGGPTCLSPASRPTGMGPHAEDAALLARRGLELVGVVIGQSGQARDAGGHLGHCGGRRGPGSLRGRRIGRARAAGPPQGLGGVGPRCGAGSVGMVEGDLRGFLTGAHTHSLSWSGAV